MKRILPLLTILLLVGCTSLYTGVVTLTSVVDSAMKDWAAMSAAGKSTAKIDAAVTVAHDKYRAAAAVAQTALVAYKNGGDQQAWISALSAVRAVASDLVDLIVPIVSPTEASTLKTKLTKASAI